MAKAKRRDDGEGSAYQLSDGRWRAEVTIGWETLPGGRRRRVRRYIYGRSQAEVNRARRELLIKREQGELPVGDEVTLGAWMAYYLGEIAVHKIRPTTWDRYDDLNRNWITPVIGDVRLRDLAPEHLDLLQAKMRDGRARKIPRKDGSIREIPARPLAPATRLQAHRVLSRALKVAMQRGKVTRNVSTLVDAPSTAGRRAEQYLLPDQARAFLRACDGRWNAARWSVGLAIGLRQGEVLGLLWDEDVDLTAGTLTVQRQLQRRRRGGGLVLVGYAKSDPGLRTIKLPSQLVDALRAHRRAQLEARIALGPSWVGNDLGNLVFTGPRGTPITAEYDWREWRGILAEIDVPPMRQHASRHTAATLMLAQGIDPKVVSTILGHSAMQITQNLYQHVVPELFEDAAQKIGDALWG